MGKNVNIRLIDFPLIHPRASNLIKAQYRNFRDQLTKMILTSDTHRRERDKHFTYILEIIWSGIIDDVIQFNDNFSESDGIPMIFICLDNDLSREQEIRLRCRYLESFLFRLYNASVEELNTMTICNFRGAKSSQITRYNSIKFEWNFDKFIEQLICSQNLPSPFYPLLLHVNSVSTMKKTSKDSYDQYISDQANRLNANQQRIKEIRIAPVYYLLAKSSCDCGQADTGGWQESQETFLQGTIRDPIQPDRIRLAYAHK
ncbi:unnamed protein product [Rotaria sp. Silwood2]|nr:unnamed protein product [Rotaria sp. Silwood2]